MTPAQAFVERHFSVAKWAAFFCEKLSAREKRRRASRCRRSPKESTKDVLKGFARSSCH